MDNKTTYTLVTLIIVILMIPIFVVAFFNHPSADDFSYSFLTYEALQNNGNIFNLILSAIQTSIHFFKSWQGLYTSAFLLALQPAIFGEKFYALTTFIIIGTLLIGFTFLNKSIYKHILKTNNKKYILASLIIVFFLIETIPSPLEGLYWFNGSINYLFFFSLLLIEISILINYFYTQKKINIIFSIILVILISGGNHIVAFACILINIIFFLLTLIKKKTILSMLPVLLSIIFFIINITSPGTAIRASNFTHEKSILNTMYQTILMSFNYIKFWFNIPTILLIVSIIILHHNELKNIKINIKQIIILTIISYTLLASMMCIPYYAMGNFGAPRIINTFYFSFVLVFILLLCTIYSYIVDNFIKKQIIIKDTVLNITLIIIIIYIGIIGTNQSTSIQALEELTNGTLINYDIEINERLKLYLNPSVKNVLLKKINSKSKLVFLIDLEKDPNDWKNRAVRDYYKKTSVYINE